MEEPRTGQKPNQERLSPDDAPEPRHPSVGTADDPQSARERQLIEDGQARAERDIAELRRGGFGHHIGTE